MTIGGSNTVQQVYGGAEQQGAVLGPSGAPVSISVYDDLQCTGCARWFLRTVPPLVEDFVRTRKGKLIYHHFATGEKEQLIGSYAAVAAGRQGRQWQYVHLFFENQEVAQRSGVTEKFMIGVAERVPELDLVTWREDRKDPEIAQTLAADAKLAHDLRLPAEPAVVVDGPRGTRKLISSPTVAQIEAAADAVR